MSATHEDHRRFLNAYYRRVKYVYDLTRKYFLFGRDKALAELIAAPWNNLIEIGPGTGRNLLKLHAARPDATLAGIEASDEMLAMARRRCPDARLERGHAEDADYTALLGKPCDRILFSYCLSMVQDPDAALRHARRQLAPDGRIMVVDFGDFNGLKWLAPGFRRFLSAFHVTPPDENLLRRHEATVLWGPGRYYFIAVIPPTTEPQPQ